jgi:hypothetical protein
LCKNRLLYVTKNTFKITSFVRGEHGPALLANIGLVSKYLQ